MGIVYHKPCLLVKKNLNSMLSVDACNEPQPYAGFMHHCCFPYTPPSIGSPYENRPCRYCLTRSDRSDRCLFVQMASAEMHSVPRHLSRVLALLVLLRDILDLQSYRTHILARNSQIASSWCFQGAHTRGKALLQLLGLVRVLEDKGIELL